MIYPDLWAPVRLICHDCDTTTKNTDTFSECEQCFEYVCDACRAEHEVRCWGYDPSDEPDGLE